MRSSLLRKIAAASVALLASAAVSCSAAVVAYTPAALADQITNLPGLVNQPSFNMFSGYLVVNETDNRSIFYWYTESQKSPETDPLIWWSNGGPGCSGLLGFLTEHGPFRTSPTTGGLDPFPFAWNTLANTLYVEAPAGVGFSFSDNPNDYTVGDAQTAQDNYVAIQQFLVRFPHLQSNDFYISAESYGGHYVPQLAQVIVNEGTLPSFKGFLLGNPLTDMDENMNWGQAGTMCGHSLASRPTCDTFTAHCLQPGGPDAQCVAAQSQVVLEAGNLDLYGLDWPTCPQNNQARVMKQFLYQSRKQEAGFNKHLRKHLGVIPAPYDPCEMNEETVYLNRADVRAALHVNPNVGQWQSCSTTLNYSVSDGNARIEPIYSDLLASGNLRMLVFSGDDDSICATLGTQHWMFNLLGADVVQPWSTWMYTSEEYGQQIGGYLVKFKGISFATVHDAGHMVSGYRPERGLAVLSNFLAGNFN